MSDFDERAAPSDAAFDALSGLLAAEAVWADADGAIEDHLVAEIGTEAAARPRTPAAPGRADRRHLRLIAAVAVLFLVAGVGIGLVAQGSDEDYSTVALAGTDLAPGASASAMVESGPSGVRIMLDVRGLPPAEPGTFYEGWLRKSPEDGVSVGTFHMRGGDAEIELWSGVELDDYPLITVTIQQEGAGAKSSGVVVLSGTADG